MSRSIKDLFNTIAHKYEWGNTLLSLQTHRLWNRALVRHLLIPEKPMRYLDLCAGTGDIAFHYLKNRREPCEAILLDFSPAMLHLAQGKNWPKQHRLTFLEADAQDIPLENQSINCVSIAYGIRNIPNTLRCFEQIHRVLKPGGKLGILELTRPKNRILKTLHAIYLKTAVPTLGRLLTSDHEAYQHLCDSIQQFSPPEELQKQLEAVNFSDIERVSLFGGIATLILAKK